MYDWYIYSIWKRVDVQVGVRMHPRELRKPFDAMDEWTMLNSYVRFDVTVDGDNAAAAAECNDSRFCIYHYAVFTPPTHEYLMIPVCVTYMIEY